MVSVTEGITSEKTHGNRDIEHKGEQCDAR